MSTVIDLAAPVTDTLEQRWSERRSFFVAPERRFNPRGFSVEPIADDTSAKTFVEAHHYSGSFPAARWRFGLYAPGGALVGVAVFSHPCNDKVLSIFPGKPTESVELGRFVLLDEVGFNAETWFLARCFPHLRSLGLHGVVSFSDPFPRERTDGTVVHRGHLGTIYRALGARYLGFATARRINLLPDGTVFHDHTAQKIRQLRRGCQYAARLLMAQGAAPFPVSRGEESLPGSKEAAQEWLRSSLKALCRRLWHPGNLRYAWTFTAAAHSKVPEGMAYPTRAQVQEVLSPKAA